MRLNKCIKYNLQWHFFVNKYAFLYAFCSRINICILAVRFNLIIKPSEWWPITTRHQMQRVLKLELKANTELSRLASPCFRHLLNSLTVERFSQTTIRISSAIDFPYHTVIAIFPFQWVLQYRTSLKTSLCPCTRKKARAVLVMHEVIVFNQVLLPWHHWI